MGPSSRAISAIASASRRKSSSARRLCANWPSISPDRIPWPNAVRRCARLATSASAARSRSITSLMPGRCTFTTTASPVRNRARCVCPIDAAASGSHSNSANTRSTRVAQLDLQDLADRVGVGSGGTRFCSFAELLGDLGRHEVDPRGGDLTQLHVHAARFFEHAAGAAHPGWRRVRSSRPAAETNGPKPSSPDEPHELAVPAKHREAHPDRARTVVARPPARRAPPSRACPGRASRSIVTAVAIVAGIADRERMEDHPVGAPVPVGDARARRAHRCSSRSLPTPAP